MNNEMKMKEVVVKIDNATGLTYNEGTNWRLYFSDETGGETCVSIPASKVVRVLKPNGDCRFYVKIERVIADCLKEIDAEHVGK